MVPKGRQLIQAYGDGQFRIAGEIHRGSVILWPDNRVEWPVESASSIDTGDLLRIVAQGDFTEILIIGCGETFTAPPNGLRADLRSAGLSLEWMDTGAACRTFNVLLSEERTVAAALIAVE